MVQEVSDAGAPLLEQMSGSLTELKIIRPRFSRGYYMSNGGGPYYTRRADEVIWDDFVPRLADFGSAFTSLQNVEMLLEMILGDKYTPLSDFPLYAQVRERMYILIPNLNERMPTTKTAKFEKFLLKQISSKLKGRNNSRERRESEETRSNHVQSLDGLLGLGPSLVRYLQQRYGVRQLTIAVPESKQPVSSIISTGDPELTIDLQHLDEMHRRIESKIIDEGTYESFAGTFTTLYGMLEDVGAPDKVVLETFARMSVFSSKKGGISKDDLDYVKLYSRNVYEPFLEKVQNGGIEVKIRRSPG